MKRLLAISLAAILLLSVGCVGQNTSSGPDVLPASIGQDAAADGQTLEQITRAILADEAHFLSSESATKSWPKAYESFYDAYPTLAQYKLEGLGDLALRDQLAYTFFTISSADILEVYRNLADSPSSPANLFSKFFMSNQEVVGVLLNYAGTDDYFGEAAVWLSSLPPESGDKTAYIDSVKRFDVGCYRHRTSMTMTAGIEAQLLEQGFSPETTVACALSIPYAHGVCFIDGERISFYVSGGDSNTMPQDMRMGGVYPFMLIAQDIHDRIDEVDPMINNPGIPEPGTNEVTPPEGASVAPSGNESAVSSGARADRYSSDAPATLSWRTAYESFYSGGAALTPALIDTVWQGRYDHFDYATDADTGAVILRSDVGIDLVYPMLEMPFAAIEEIIANGPAGDIVKKLARNNGYYGFLASYKADNGFAGEGEVFLPQDGGPFKAMRFTGFHQGDYSQRTSMTITEGIEAQLLDCGFSSETTQAFSLAFNKNYYGVCFYDEVKAVYYNSSVIFSDILKPQIYSFEALAHRLKHIRNVDSVRDIPDDLRAPHDALPIVETPMENPITAKPVIYLYPERPTDVSVTLGYPKEELTYTYPAYEDGWQVRAEPDGTLTNLKDGSTHYYLFWEGDKKVDWNLSEGFVVKGSGLKPFCAKSSRSWG